MGKSVRKNKKSGKRMGGRKTQKMWRMTGCAHNKRTKCARCLRRRQRRGGCGCDKIIGGEGGREYSSSRSTNHSRITSNPSVSRYSSRQTRQGLSRSGLSQRGFSLQGGSLRGGSQRGGCGCGLGTQSGGSSNNALIGSPWTADISSWPGVQGVPGVTNHYNLNEYKSFDPQTQMGSERVQNGGTRKNKRGGGLIPQDLVNMGRNMMFGVGSAYNSLSGYQAPVNPLPYKNQLMNPNPSRTLGY